MLTYDQALKDLQAYSDKIFAQQAEIERLTDELAQSANEVGVSKWRRDECLRLRAALKDLYDSWPGSEAAWANAEKIVMEQPTPNAETRAAMREIENGGGEIS